MVVLDAIHKIQARAPTISPAAGTARRASVALLGRDQRASAADVHDPPVGPAARGAVTVEPMRAFPLIRDLVTDVSWNYR